MSAHLSFTIISLQVLAVTQGRWGERIFDNVSRFHPSDWTVQRWPAPRVLPPVIDDPADYLPDHLPNADLLLALGESPGVAALIPDIARLCGARAVIAPIDRNEWLPPGLVNQLRGWLNELGVAAVFPRPFCSLTETTYNQPPITVEYSDPFIREFARLFGRPRLRLQVNAERRIEAAQVERDSPCGCARHVAAGLRGCPVSEAEQAAGMLHHHFPCLAGMTQDSDYRDTLMHVSGHLLREAVGAELEPYREVVYLRPSGRVDD
jgi:hypothetical protein